MKARDTAWWGGGTSWRRWGGDPRRGSGCHVVAEVALATGWDGKVVPDVLVASVSVLWVVYAMVKRAVRASWFALCDDDAGMGGGVSGVSGEPPYVEVCADGDVGDTRSRGRCDRGGAHGCGLGGRDAVGGRLSGGVLQRDATSEAAL